jgi:hypothetical protein
VIEQWDIEAGLPKKYKKWAKSTISGAGSANDMVKSVERSDGGKFISRSYRRRRAWWSGPMDWEMSCRRLARVYKRRSRMRVMQLEGCFQGGIGDMYVHSHTSNLPVKAVGILHFSNMSESLAADTERCSRARCPASYALCRIRERTSLPFPAPHRSVPRPCPLSFPTWP